MTETKNATTEDTLYAALAKVQAELPKVGKDGEGQYGKYARLEDVSHVIMPLLGKAGLTFIARPTLQDGELVLAYSLVHVSGEREDGVYPLVSDGTPQRMGSAITYARRYCLCAVTGIAPGGDDDDAQSAQQAQPWKARPARDESWRDTNPVQPRRREEAPAQDDSAQWETPPAEPVTDMDWMADLVDNKIPAAKDKETLNAYWTAVGRKQKAGECTAEHGRQIQAVITEQAKALGLPEKAKADAAANGKQAEPVAT